MHACLLVSECMRVWVLAGRATGGHREVHRGRPCAGCDVPMKAIKANSNITDYCLGTHHDAPACSPLTRCTQVKRSCGLLQLPACCLLCLRVSVVALKDASRRSMWCMSAGGQRKSVSGAVSHSTCRLRYECLQHRSLMVSHGFGPDRTYSVRPQPLRP